MSHIQTRNFLVLPLYGFLVVMQVGCGGTGYRSPEAVYAAAENAAKERDFATFCRCLTPQRQLELATLYALKGAATRKAAELGGKVAGFSTQIDGLTERAKSIGDVLDKHGLTSEKTKDFSLNGGLVEKASVVVDASVPNKAAFIGDYLDAFTKLMPGKPPSTPITGFEGKLESVEISDDSAVGNLAGGGSIGFVKIDGRWYLEL
jgi:hypothetical protein